MPDADEARITPASIRQHGPRALAIRWGDGRESVYPVRALRLACGCASCVDEWTGAGRLDPAGVPEDVHPLRIQPVGRYGLQIRWSDGHETGIYPFQRLRELDPGAPPRE
jgi:DUF971 family protein